ncbi:MAG TPA: hypothetical protein VK534_01845 [Methylomirabilota bacterium]|nr:hypothetical protein [Methylomirabilota bacterium]
MEDKNIEAYVQIPELHPAVMAALEEKFGEILVAASVDGPIINAEVDHMGRE